MPFPPAFLITVDTEGDNVWAKPRAVTTRNAAFISRFQGLCEKYGLRPTYLTNWEMANSPVFQEFARDALARGTVEVGMHLHAWDSPPIEPLTADDVSHAPYLIEYPEAVIREKVKVMTGTLETAFQRKMRSHRSGRWSFDETYARVLIEHGYEVDCSVTPHVDWRFCKGAPGRPGGTDYSRFPEEAYFVDERDISKAGNSPLLELPVTIVRTRKYPWPVERIRRGLSSSFYGTVGMMKLFPHYQWLMPTADNRDALLRVIATAREQKRKYIEMALHSSELMPGGSPKLGDEASVEKLYENLDSVFAFGTRMFGGSTLSEYRDRVPVLHGRDAHATTGGA